MSATESARILILSRPEALEQVDELVKAGPSPRTSVRLLPENEGCLARPRAPPQRVPTIQSETDKGFWASLTDFFLPDDDRILRPNAMNRGKHLVSVTRIDRLT